MDYLIKEETLTDIADAIRSKTSSQSSIMVSDFAMEISGIATGSLQFKPIFLSGTAGSETVVIQEPGKYLILNFISAYGSATISIPTTPIINFSKTTSDSRGLKCVVADLGTGDSIVIENTVSSWVYNFKAVFKLEGISVSQVIDSTQVSDGSLTVFSPTYSGNIVCIAACGGRQESNAYDRSGVIYTDLTWASHLNTNSYLRLTYGDVPTYNLYGYDGGCALVIALQ